MRILFQGGWREGRDPPETKSITTAYCRALARQIAKSRHKLILTSPKGSEKTIADELAFQVKRNRGDLKNYLIYLLSNRYSQTPREGAVLKFLRPQWWSGERTYLVQQADVVMAIGGGRGTVDCMEKAFLAKKPVFVSCALRGPSAFAWDKRPQNYYYLEPGDSDFVSDLNTTPDEFMRHAFKVVDQLSEKKYPRRVFIVHGKDHPARDKLATALESLNLDAIVLEKEPSRSLTIIEKLEKNLENIGFGFVLYTPDDVGRAPNEAEKPRARQNVVLEHGILLGILGRERTCALIQGDIEIPSDLHGVIYERFISNDTLPTIVAKVLKEAGYAIEENAIR
jgi:CAP12/Pycsar effector protein, TIR domain